MSCTIVMYIFLMLSTYSRSKIYAPFAAPFLFPFELSTSLQYFRPLFYLIRMCNKGFFYCIYSMQRAQRYFLENELGSVIRVLLPREYGHLNLIRIPLHPHLIIHVTLKNYDLAKSFIGNTFTSLKYCYVVKS